MGYRNAFLLGICLALLPQAAAAGEFSARLLCFDDSIYFSQDLRKPLEKLLSDPDSGIKLERVEERTAYYKQGSFAWPPQGGAPAVEMRGHEGDIRRQGRTPGLETSWSALIQHPMVSPELNAKLRALAADPASGGGTQGQISESDFELGSIWWPDGESAAVFLKPGKLNQQQWVRTTAVSYHVRIGSAHTVLTVFAKPRGGMGAQYDSIRERLTEYYQPTAIVNFSSIAEYAENGIISTDTLRAYWKDLGVGVVAPSGLDLKTLFSMGAAQPGDPAVICTNAQPSDDAGPQPVAKYAVREVDGIRLGFIALAEDPAAYYQEQLPFRVVSPIAAATEAVRRLRDEEKTDFIVALSRLDNDETDSVLASVPNIDLLLTADGQTRFSSKTVKMELQSWRRDRQQYPVYTAQIKTGRLSELLLEFNQSGELKEPVLVEEKNTDDYAQEDLFDNKYYRATDAYLDRFFSSSDPVLPEPRLVWPQAPQARYAYHPLEIYTIAANALREESGAEITALRILPLSGSGTGAVTRPRLTYWLHSQNDIVVAPLTGAQVSKILSQADFGALPSNSETDYDASERYAVSGVDKDRKIYGSALSSSEIYTVALPKNLYRKVSAGSPPPAPDKVKSMSLSDAVSQRLAAESGKAGYYSDALFAAYISSRTAPAPGLPAAVKSELDQLSDDSIAATQWRQWQEQSQGRLAAAIAALADDRTITKTVWRINLRELTFIFSRTYVKNPNLYADFSDARIRADSQMTMKGVMRLYAESYTTNFRNDAGIIAEYGKLRVSPVNADEVESETADRLQFVDDYMYRWKQLHGRLEGVTMGPFLSLGYDTEFTAANNTPFKKIVRGKGGMKLFDGPWLKSLYAAAVVEEDFTYSPSYSKYAWETGYEVRIPLQGKTVFSSIGTYRNFFSGANTRPTDYQYELELSGRIDSEFIGSVKVGPYFELYRAKGKLVPEAGENLKFGISVSYAFISKPLF
ncbi:MAG: hypothetical protein GX410_03525 [Elusimicrobia bacterium]|nr:hypothetical protein [Elusimicrobiota bacterium]